jgi:hypothetical protein
LWKRAIGLRGTSVSAVGLARFSGFHVDFLTIAVLLIAEGAFFSVFGGFGNCIYVLRYYKQARAEFWARRCEAFW